MSASPASDRLVRAGDDVPLDRRRGHQGQSLPHPLLQVNATLTREINDATKVLGQNGATTTRNNVTRGNRPHLAVHPRPRRLRRAKATPSPSQPTHRPPLPHPPRHRPRRPRRSPPSPASTSMAPRNTHGSTRTDCASNSSPRKPNPTRRNRTRPRALAHRRHRPRHRRARKSPALVPRRTPQRQPGHRIPLTDDDAPNAFVSVLVIKGAQGIRTRTQGTPTPPRLLRTARRKPTRKTRRHPRQPAPSYRPGEEITLTGKIQLADGKPAANAEVTFFAEDEGTLAVMGYDTPDPMAFFYQPTPPRRRFRHLVRILHFGKPRVPLLLQQRLLRRRRRRHVVARRTAQKLRPLRHLGTRPHHVSRWHVPPHFVKLPDTLTRYRVIAVAHHATARFGHAESAITGKKDLMLEPKPPRFAHQGDALRTQLLVQNASTHNGTWEITFNPHAASGTTRLRYRGLPHIKPSPSPPAHPPRWNSPSKRGNHRRSRPHLEPPPRFPSNAKHSPRI
jgi:alpha-2-macroglobulin